jgi:dephospho-CoA kinase
MKPLTPNTPHVIIMVGIPGAGKTTFAKRFAKTFNAPYINPRDISDLAGINAQASARVTMLLFNELLKTNHTLVYKALIIWVQTDPTEAKNRAIKIHRGVTSLSEEAFDMAYKQFQNPTLSEKPVVISGKHTYATQLKTVLKRLATTTRSDIPPSNDQSRIIGGRNIIVR